MWGEFKFDQFSLAKLYDTSTILRLQLYLQVRMVSQLGFDVDGNLNVHM